MEVANVNSTMESILGSIPKPPFQVYSPQTKQIVATVTENKIHIAIKRIRNRIERGIHIQPFLEEKFKKVIVCPDDPEYYAAFISAECVNLIRSGYRIRPIKENV